MRAASLYAGTTIDKSMRACCASGAAKEVARSTGLGMDFIAEFADTATTKWARTYQYCHRETRRSPRGICRGLMGLGTGSAVHDRFVERQRSYYDRADSAHFDWQTSAPYFCETEATLVASVKA